MKKNINIIVAHPDDEILGCGGVIAKHKNQGDKVNCFFLSTGIDSRGGETYDKKKLRRDCEKANKILGVDNLEFFSFPDNMLDTIPTLEIIKKIELILTNHKCDTLYTHDKSDLNIDHKVINNAVQTACRPINNNCPSTILACEINSSTEWTMDNKDLFSPNYFCDISSTIEKKIKALSQYKSEIRKWPHSRSNKGILALAEYRGMQSNFKFAEAFRVMRIKIN